MGKERAASEALEDTITEAEAERLGYVQLTNSYSSHENAILEKAIATLRDGGIDFRKVRIGKVGIQIWRHPKGYRANKEEIKKMLKKPAFGVRII